MIAGVCAGVSPTCLASGWVCLYPAGYEPVEATCDAVDNDCDGQTDEGCVDPDDVDGDGVPNAGDNCPNVVNPDQADRDTDDRGDACDNCPWDPNPDQGDIDRDGRGDICLVRIQADVAFSCYRVDEAGGLILPPLHTTEGNPDIYQKCVGGDIAIPDAGFAICRCAENGRFFACGNSLKAPGQFGCE